MCAQAAQQHAPTYMYLYYSSNVVQFDYFGMGIGGMFVGLLLHVHWSIA